MKKNVPSEKNKIFVLHHETLINNGLELDTTFNAAGSACQLR
jgi:hypothetical protein